MKTKTSDCLKIGWSGLNGFWEKTNKQTNKQKTISNYSTYTVVLG